MFQRHTRTKIALAALLAGALALPGLAAAHGDRDWEKGRRGDWHHERDWRRDRDWRHERGGYYGREGREWRHREAPRYDNWDGYRHHRRPVVGGEAGLSAALFRSPAAPVSVVGHRGRYPQRSCES